MATARKIEDAGKKIGGARKDMWRHRAMHVAELEAMNPEEAGRFVIKDHVWPVDYAAHVAAGTPREVVALVKVCRDRMAAKPDLMTLEAGTRERRDPDALRRDFVTMTGIARDVLMACRTRDEVLQARHEIMRRAGYNGRLARDADAKNLFYSVLKDRYSPFEFRGAEQDKAAKLVADGFPESVPAWRANIKIRRDGDATYSVWRARKRLLDGAASEEDALDRLKRLHDASVAAKDGLPPEPERPHLDVLTRSGMPDHRGGRSVDSQEFIETFGFSGVEFGNWVPGDERQRVVDLAYDAVHDIAGVLGVSPEALSFGGALSVAFGSRGKGRFSAHYEASTRAVNMTRLSGAGSLAHELGHAFDHMAGEIAQASLGTGDVRSGSGWHVWTRDRVKAAGHLGAEAASAWNDLMLLLRERPRTRDEKARDLRRAAEETRTVLAQQTRRLEQYRERMPEGRNKDKVVGEIADWCERAARRVESYEGMAAATEAGPEQGDFGRTQTRYMDEALKLSNGNPKGYWARPNEMFTRAFECYVYDRIAADGGQSQYLVHGVDDGMFSGPEFKGDPYPAGDERIAISAAMERLMAAMAPHLEAGIRAERDDGPRI